jgi:hypothetical protein
VVTLLAVPTPALPTPTLARRASHRSIVLAPREDPINRPERVELVGLAM